jgi:hypothetical protein
MKFFRAIGMLFIMFSLSIILGILYGAFQIYLFNIPFLAPMFIGFILIVILFFYASMVRTPRKLTSIFGLLSGILTLLASIQIRYIFFKYTQRNFFLELSPAQYDYLIDIFLQEETGKTGLLGYLLFEGQALPPALIMNGMVLSNSTLDNTLFIFALMAEILFIVFMPFASGLQFERHPQSKNLSFKDVAEIICSDLLNISSTNNFPPFKF